MLYGIFTIMIFVFVMSVELGMIDAKLCNQWKWAKKLYFLKSIVFFSFCSLSRVRYYLLSSFSEIA